MSILPMHVIRYGLALLGTAAAVGCSSEGDGVTDPGSISPGSISLSLSETSATVQQGGSQTVTATLTRIGGFTGTVNLTVTGAESGVTAAVSNMQTSGSVTTAIVTIFAGVAVPAVYPLVVHGTGKGVDEVTQAFTLTVPVPSLGISISLSESALSIMQGASTPTTTVSITRLGHQATSVGLYVTGLPAGVTDSFDPASWPVGASTVLTLTVSATAVPGSYNLQVNAYDPEQEGDVSAPLTLTVTAPPPGPPGYALSLSWSALSVAPGTTSYPPTTLELLRTSFTGNVTLSVDSLPTGVTAAFYPVNPTSGSSSRFWLSVAPNAVPGTYPNLQVRGVASGLADRTTPLTLTIPVAPFSLTLSSSTLSIVQGAATPTTTVDIVRNNFAGPVDLHVGWYDEDHDVLPPGVTAAFAPNPATGNSTVLTLTAGSAATPGVHYLFVFAGASTGGWCCVPLTLTVTAASP
jgi:hypothetical protein